MKIWLEERHLSKHIQIIGTTGSRKSSLTRRLVYQALDRGWPCVFLDLAREYVQEFYRPEVDFLLDVADKRCPRWMIGQEATNELYGMAIADGAFPDEPRRSFFFQDHTRSIFAFIISGKHPYRSEVSCSKIAHWLANPKFLDMIVKGTEHASTLSKNSADQRNGILGTLNHLGRALRWVPDDEGRREFTIKQWAEQKKGHIFLSSSPNTFAAVRPMQSLLFDMALLAIQSHAGPFLVIADEVGEFQRSPQLERAMAMQRKAGSPIILAYQVYAQLEEHYGEKMAESISSNAYTNIVMRTKNQHSAEHASALLGMPAELDRLRESETKMGLFYRGQHRSWQEVREMVAPVTPGEIQSLPDGDGYISQEGKITKLKISWFPPVNAQPSFLPRLSSQEMSVFELEAKSSLADRAKAMGFRLVPIEDDDGRPRAKRVPKAAAAGRPYKNRYTSTK